jgi:GT2 family glycosyltransferase
MDRRVHVLLPVHNRRQITERVIACLEQQTWPNIHVLLIDDGSTDGTSQMVLEHIPDATVIRGSGKWWWAGSLDRGYSWLERSGVDPDDVVLILNDDTIFGPEFITNAVEELESANRTLLLAQARDPDSGEIDAGVHADWSTLNFRIARRAEDVNCFSTRGLFLRVRDMREIGRFHPILLPHYASDYEYTIRAHRKGFTFRTSSRVMLTLRNDTTGYRQVGRGSLVEELRKAFSPRALYNPVFWSSFILLACPARYMPRNLWMVWRSFLLTVFRHRAGR